MKGMHLFSGAGGGLLASKILGHESIAAVEWEHYACQVLRERAADGWFPDLRVHEGDVRLFDPSEYAGKVDIIHAGFPCTDISVAGNQAGLGEGTHSGLYTEVLRIADVVRPEYIFMENVAAIVTGNNGDWLRTVIGDLAEIGFDAVWCCLSAAQIGAKHKRDRWWLLGCPKHDGHIASEIRTISETRNGSYAARSEQASKPSGSGQQYEDVGNTTSAGLQNRRQPQREACDKKTRTGVESESKRSDKNVPDTDKSQCDRNRCAIANEKEHRAAWRPCMFCGHEFGHGLLGENGCPNCEGQTEPDMGGMAYDVADTLDRYETLASWSEVEAKVGRVIAEKRNRSARLKAIGNGQVPLQAAVAFTYLWKIMESARGL